MMKRDTKEFWAKLLSIGLAVLFILHGALWLYVGIAIELVLRDYNSIISYPSASPAIVITIGIGMIALGVVGLKGLYTENALALKLNAILTLLFVVLELVTGILCFVFAQSAAMQVAEGLHFNASSYGIEDSTVIGQSVDSLQKEFECCGYDNFLDWNNNPAYACRQPLPTCQLPDTCCAIQVHLSCLYLPVDDNSSQTVYRGNAYQNGCLFAFTKWLEIKLDTIGIISLSSVVLQVICWPAMSWYVLQMHMRSSVYALKYPTIQQDICQ